MMKQSQRCGAFRDWDTTETNGVVRGIAHARPAKRYTFNTVIFGAGVARLAFD